MADIAIVYASVHHGNTKKLLDGIASVCSVDLYSAEQASDLDLTRYKAVGFASGIYKGCLHTSLYAFLDKEKPLPKNVFVMCTSGSGGKKYGSNFSKRLSEKGKQVLGVFSCKGFDTFGPWKLIGGIAKGRPNTEDIATGVSFMQNTVENQML